LGGFNGDGSLDLVIDIDGNHISTYYNDGSGNFSLAFFTILHRVSVTQVLSRLEISMEMVWATW
jgi:hypothetical protein